MITPLLSILTPCVPSRLVRQPFARDPAPVIQLINGIEKMIRDFPVEHLVLCDNKQRSIGGKRQALLEIARGEYVAFVDDDDDIDTEYLAELIPRLKGGADVVTFEQEAIINDVAGRIIFDAACRIDEPWKPGGIARRRPWHVCAWRRELALQGVFVEVNYGEDAAWVDQVAPLARTTLHIPKVLHYYRHSSATTEAPPPGK